jgi:hypothetical protein
MNIVTSYALQDENLTIIIHTFSFWKLTSILYLISEYSYLNSFSCGLNPYVQRKVVTRKVT